MMKLMMIPQIMATLSSHHGTAAGTAGGTVLSVLATIQSGDLTKTVILAALGAVVSFGVSLALKWVAKRWSRSR